MNRNITKKEYLEAIKIPENKPKVTGICAGLYLKKISKNISSSHYGRNWNKWEDYIKK